MRWNRRELQGFAVVVGLSLAAAMWIQTARSVRVGTPGSMSQPHAVAAQQAEVGPEDLRSDTSGTKLTQLSPTRTP